LQKVGETSESFEFVQRGLALARAYIAEDRTRSATITYGAELFQQGADFLASKGRQEEAIEVYHEAIEILERLAAETNQASVDDVIARYEAAVGDLYAGFDSETSTIKATNQMSLLKARKSYQQSLDTLRGLQQRDLFFPDLPNRLAEVSRKLSACEGTLGKLKS